MTASVATEECVFAPEEFMKVRKPFDYSKMDHTLTSRTVMVHEIVLEVDGEDWGNAYMLEDVPHWMDELADIIWFGIPDHMNRKARHFIREYIRLRPDTISDAVSVQLYREYVLGLMPTIRKACKKCPEAVVLVEDVEGLCRKAAAQKCVQEVEWERMFAAARRIYEVHPEDTVVHQAMQAVAAICKNDCSSAANAWKALERVSVKGKECPTTMPRMQRLIDTLFGLFREGTRRTAISKAARTRGAAGKSKGPRKQVA